MSAVIIIASRNWKGHGGPFLAVPISSIAPIMVDVPALLGEVDAIYTRRVTWSDGVGLEFHTLQSSGGRFNQATYDVMARLGMMDEDDEEDNNGPLPCTIVTSLGRLPLTRPMYDWFSEVCEKSIY